MKTTTVFENKIRESSFASLPAARSAIAADPLTAEYIVDHLISRGLLRVRLDGAVVGAGRGAGAEEAESGEVKPWNPAWARRSRILSNLDREDGEPPAKFRKLQENLKEDGEPCTHWVTLHAVWNLMKAGVVEKRATGYVLTAAGKKECEDKHQAERAAERAAFAKHGEATTIEHVAAELSASPFRHLFDDIPTWLTADWLDHVRAQRLNSSGAGKSTK